jgi:predicted RNA-binding protein Jag
MKSVIAQGSTVTKAVEEALKKAGMPEEFFVKLLEDAQGGFLGFGAKKAKIALFFKQNQYHSKHDSMLNQDSFQDLFDSNEISKQIEQQLKDVGSPQAQKSQPQQRPADQRPTQRPVQRPMQRPMQNRPLPTRPSQSAPTRTLTPQSQQKPAAPKPAMTQDRPQSSEQANRPQSHSLNQNYKKQQEQPQQGAPVKPKENNISKLMVRPLPNKNNDSSKS